MQRGALEQPVTGADTGRGCFCEVLLRWLLTAEPAGTCPQGAEVWAEGTQEGRAEGLGMAGGWRGAVPSQACCAHLRGWVAWGARGRDTCFCMCRPCPCGSPVRRPAWGHPAAKRPQTSAPDPSVPDATLRFSGELDSVLETCSKNKPSTNYLKN